MMAGVLEQILSASQGADLKRVRVPEWGVDLYFGKVTGADRVAIRRGIAPKAEEELLLSSLQRLALDADGAPVFPHDQATRVKMLKSLDMGVVMRVLHEAGVEKSPRVAMIEDASEAKLREAVRVIGDLSADAEADLSEAAIEAIRKLMLAREPELADVLSAPGGPSANGGQIKNG